MGIGGPVAMPGSLGDGRTRCQCRPPAETLSSGEPQAARAALCVRSIVASHGDVAETLGLAARGWLAERQPLAHVTVVDPDRRHHRGRRDRRSLRVHRRRRPRRQFPSPHRVGSSVRPGVIGRAGQRLSHAGRRSLVRDSRPDLRPGRPAIRDSRPAVRLERRNCSSAADGAADGGPASDLQLRRPDAAA
jgi:hypothetical protein